MQSQGRSSICAKLWKAWQALKANVQTGGSASAPTVPAFQAAISALLRERIGSRTGGQWPYAFVQGEFAGKLINRNRRYPSFLRSTLPDLQTLRSRADYHPEAISEIEAQRGLRRSRELVDAIRSRGGSPG